MAVPSLCGRGVRVAAKLIDEATWSTVSDGVPSRALTHRLYARVRLRVCGHAPGA